MFSEAYEFLARGGPLMVPIALCAVVGLTVFLERLWVLQKNRILPPHFLSVLEPYVRDRRWDDVRRLCDSSTSAIATLLRSCIRYTGQSRQVVRDSLEETGRRLHFRMHRFVGVLGAIANIAPLLGLLGTVTGMIEVFQRVDDTIQQTGDVQAGVLAAGIWEALMTTAAGLAIAIPAFIGFKYLGSRIDYFTTELEEKGDFFSDHVSAAFPTDSAISAVSQPQQGEPTEKTPLKPVDKSNQESDESDEGPTSK